jgi:5-methyltetrahydropteroyltriglutamate--homocysteine methyltransferase
LIASTDVGSLPTRADYSTLLSGARKFQSQLHFLGLDSALEQVEVFEDEVKTAFVEKLKRGIDVPSYPQFRDMNEMFLETIRGVEKTSSGYTAQGRLSATPNKAIPEVAVLKQSLSEIRDGAQLDRVPIKICVTGPYTLASLFKNRSKALIGELGDALAEITTNSIFDNRYGGVRMVCVDEPALGFLNDPLLDFGSEGREALRNAWENVCRAAASKGAETSIHLHNTSEGLFWDIKHLNVLESHVDDPLYELGDTKRRLEETDKTLKASVGLTVFDDLIKTKVATSGADKSPEELIGETWTKIRHGEVDPLTFLEQESVMRERLRKVVDRFGSERVRYAGPECGLRSFPTYGCAMECLRKTASAIREESG